MSAQLFPKPARRLRQPTKCVLREQLALAADRIIELEAACDEAAGLLILADLRQQSAALDRAESWWRRLLARIRAWL